MTRQEAVDIIRKDETMFPIEDQKAKERFNNALEKADDAVILVQARHLLKINPALND